MPDRFKQYALGWLELNPGWRVKEWSWHNLPEKLANADVMEDLRQRCTSGTSTELPTQLADILGYEIVLMAGGIYVNADIQPVRPILEAMTDGRAWASLEDGAHIVNAAIGGPAGHPFWQAVVEELPRRYWHMRSTGQSSEMNQMTGPHLLGDCARRFTGHAYLGGLHVFGQETFNPVHWSQIPFGETAEGRFDVSALPPGTVGVHHWHHREIRRSNVVS
jgi:mannosyltransferase OCH1-like enzyme